MSLNGVNSDSDNDDKKRGCLLLWVQNVTVDIQDTSFVVVTTRIVQRNSMTNENSKSSPNQVKFGCHRDADEKSPLHNRNTIIFRIKTEGGHFWIRNWKFDKHPTIYTKTRHHIKSNDGGGSGSIKPLKNPLCHTTKCYVDFHGNGKIPGDSEKIQAGCTMGKVLYESEKERLRKIDMLGRILDPMNRSHHTNRSGNDLLSKIESSNWMHVSSGTMGGMNLGNDIQCTSGGNSIIDLIQKSQNVVYSDYRSEEILKFQMYESRMSLSDVFMRRSRIKPFDIIHFDMDQFQNNKKSMDINDESAVDTLVLTMLENTLIKCMSMQMVSSQHDMLMYSVDWIDWNMSLFTSTTITTNKKSRNLTENAHLHKMFIWMDVEGASIEHMGQIQKDQVSTSGIRYNAQERLLSVPMWNDEYCSHFNFQYDDMNKYDRLQDTQHIKTIYVYNEITETIHVFTTNAARKISKSDIKWKAMRQKQQGTSNKYKDRFIPTDEEQGEEGHRQWDVNVCIVECMNELEALSLFMKHCITEHQKETIPRIIIPVSLYDSSLYNLKSDSNSYSDNYKSLRSYLQKLDYYHHDKGSRVRNDDSDDEHTNDSIQDARENDFGFDLDDDDDDEEEDETLETDDLSTQKKDSSKNFSKIRKFMKSNTSPMNDFIFSPLHYIFMRVLYHAHRDSELESVSRKSVSSTMDHMDEDEYHSRDGTESSSQDSAIFVHSLSSNASKVFRFFHQRCTTLKTMDQCLFNDIIHYKSTGNSVSIPAAHWCDFLMDAYQLILMGKNVNSNTTDNIFYQMMTHDTSNDQYLYSPIYNDKFKMTRSVILYHSMMCRMKQSDLFRDDANKHLLHIKICDRNIYNVHMKKYKQTTCSSSSKNNGTVGKKKKDVEGASVNESVNGVNMYVLLVDFASLYSSIMSECNICFTSMRRRPVVYNQKNISSGGSSSSSTFSKKRNIHDMKQLNVNSAYHSPSNTSNGNIIFSKRSGLIPVFMLAMIQGRNVLKKKKEVMKSLTTITDSTLLQVSLGFLGKMEQLLKNLVNILYGLLASHEKMFSNVAIANKITEMGRSQMSELNKLTDRINAEKTNKLCKNDILTQCHIHNLEVVYGDTDSAMIRIQWDTKDLSLETKILLGTKKLSPYICKYFEEKHKYIRLKTDGFFEFVFIMNKKCYYAIPLNNSPQLAEMLKDIMAIEEISHDLDNSQFHSLIMENIVKKHSNALVHKGTPSMRSDTKPIGKLVCLKFVLWIHRHRGIFANHCPSTKIGVKDNDNQQRILSMTNVVNEFLDVKKSEYLQDVLVYSEKWMIGETKRQIENWEETNMIRRLKQPDYAQIISSKYNISHIIRRRVDNAMIVAGNDLGDDDRMNVSLEIMQDDIQLTLMNLWRHINALIGKFASDNKTDPGIMKYISDTNENYSNLVDCMLQLNIGAHRGVK